MQHQVEVDGLVLTVQPLTDDARALVEANPNGPAVVTRNGAVDGGEQQWDVVSQG